MGVSVFDLDRTLTRRGTYLRFLVFAAVRLRPWRLTLLPLVLVSMTAYKLGALGRTRLKEVMHRLLLGPSLEAHAARRIADGFATRLFTHGLHRQGIAQIGAERACGRLVAIATAASELYARPLAERLGVEHLLATLPTWENDRLMSGIAGLNCYGGEKLARFQRFVSEQGLHDAHVRVFSDDVSDRPLFERCDDAVAVNPSPALRRLARERGWRVLDWRTPPRLQATQADGVSDPVTSVDAQRPAR